MIRKYWLLGLTALAIAVLARVYFWPQAPSAPTQQSGAPAAPTPRIESRPMLAHKSGTVVRATTATPEKPASPSATYRYQDPNDPRALFENPANTVDARFTALAHLARAGNADAKYFALQIAHHCALISTEPDDKPAQGQSAATPYQIQLHSQMKAACAQVMADAAYPEYEKQLQSHEIENYADRMRQTLQLFFADKGPDAAIHAAVSAIAQRPDDSTVTMVGDMFADLDIASVYFQPEVASAAPDDPQKRIALTRFALNLLACHYGRPCGPDSFAVKNTCIELGACLPGADLLGVYESQLLTPKDMNYVRLLLDYLKQFPTNVAWG